MELLLPLVVQERVSWKGEMGGNVIEAISTLFVLPVGFQAGSGGGCEWMGQGVRGGKGMLCGRSQQGEGLGQWRQTGHRPQTFGTSDLL